MTRPSLRPAIVAAAVATALVVAFVAVACTGGDDNGPSSKAPSGATSAGPGTQPSPTAPPPLATVRGDIAGLLLQVRALERAPEGTVTARFVLVNNGAERLLVGGRLGDFTTTPQRQDVSGAYLFDGAKRYNVAKNGDECACSKLPLGLDPGEQTEELSASFTAPGPDVDRVSLVVLHFPPIDGLTLPE